ncbi:mevalonate kinase-like, partial [Lingula anatina]
PAPPSEELLQKLKTFASIPHDSADTKTLALVSFLYLYCAIVGSQKTLTPLEIRIESKLPVSAGLGSSAAYSVCLAASLLLHKNLISASGKWSEKDLQLINAWAFQAEKVIHGKPSGIDNSVSTYGHAVSFTKGSEPVILSQVPSIRILLVNTKVPRSTKTLVESVKKKYDKSTVVMSAVMDTMEAVAKECLILFEKMYKGKADEYYKQLEELIYINQQQLDIIGVSHIALEKVIQITKANGLCSKLTGAGGGGCAFALIRPDVPKETLDCVIQQLSLEGFDCWETGIGAEGVTLHV